MARVVVAAVDGRSGGRGVAPVDKEKKEAEEKDVVPFVVRTVSIPGDEIDDLARERER